ncbi:hypothetical protein [Spirosoma rigui]|uniref:hypothetical protein n=1 Tax=Spirosoma rigui TaxID=564064 RepID=UPI0009AF8F54|nr:hypothetical protein [Spirosoma rigui]
MIRHTDDIKQQVERILNWGPSKHWRQRDFTQLSELVATRTDEHVDARDLQLFWQVSWASSPAILDALAHFADYDDWDDFCRRNAYGVVDTDDETRLTHLPGWEVPTKWVIVICWLSVVASILVGLALCLSK